MTDVKNLIEMVKSQIGNDVNQTYDKDFLFNQILKTLIQQEKENQELKDKLSLHLTQNSIKRN